MRKIHKKGSLLDLFFFAILFAFFSLSILLGTTIASKFVDKVGESQVITDIEPDLAGKTVQAKNSFIGSMDGAFLFAAIMVALGMLILASLVRIHPIFIPVFIVPYLFLIFISAALSNVYQKMASNATIGEIANQYAAMNNFMTFYPIVVGVLGVILMVVMYKQWSVAQQ